MSGVVTPPASSLCVCRCCGLCGSACASLRPDLAQGPASAASHRGLGGESETLVVGVCSVPDGFTRSLVLGMPRADSLPASKPGRPQQSDCTGEDGSPEREINPCRRQFRHAGAIEQRRHREQGPARQLARWSGPRTGPFHCCRPSPGDPFIARRPQPGRTLLIIFAAKMPVGIRR
jgi:hypothetical protein